jgi:SAM-dependent methyltransferase
MSARDPFDRLDLSDDADFYASPRLVNHIEAGAIEALRAAYGRIVPSPGRVLDLMSAWRSHLPHGLTADRPHRHGWVTGLGMNAIELAENPQLDERVVHDLNRTPRLPFDDDSFDAAVCTVSIQYLTRPIEVLTDLMRTVRSGGTASFAFSNRCFPTKAVAIWQAGGDAHHGDLLEAYLTMAHYDDIIVEQLESPDDPIFVATGRVPG